MAAPAYGSSGTAQAGGYDNTVILGVPSGTAADDIVIAWIYNENTLSNTPTGFTLKVEEASAGQAISVYWKRLTGADSGSYQWTHADGDWCEGVAIRYTGCITTGDPFDVFDSANQASGTNTPAVSNTTTVVDTLQLWGGTNFNGGAWTPPSGYTERYDDSGDLTVSELVQAGIGGSGSITGTCAGGSTQSSAFLGALKPPAAAAASSLIVPPRRLHRARLQGVR